MQQPTNPMQITKVETKYQVKLKASEYDYLEVTQDIEGRITVKFLDTRWRTVDEAIALFEEITSNLKKHFASPIDTHC